MREPPFRASLPAPLPGFEPGTSRLAIGCSGPIELQGHGVGAEAASRRVQPPASLTPDQTLLPGRDHHTSALLPEILLATGAGPRRNAGGRRCYVYSRLKLGASARDAEW